MGVVFILGELVTSALHTTVHDLFQQPRPRVTRVKSYLVRFFILHEAREGG